MRAYQLRWATVLVVLLSVPASASCETVTYGFINIADTSGLYSSFDPASPPRVNASGTVAFRANLDAGGSGVFTSSGGQATTVADTSGPLSGFFGRLSINSAGTVAFLANQDAGGFGIFRGSGGSLTTIAVAGPVFSSLGTGPGISNSGIVAFLGTSAAAESVLRGTGGTPIPIASTGPTFANFFDFVDINAQGRVAFRADLTVGGSGIFTGIIPPAGGVLITPIADTSGPFSGFGNGFPSLNAAGTVVFNAALDAGGVGIFTGNGGAITTIVDSSGPFLVFDAFPAINAAGEVAFLGLLDSGVRGIFTGPDPVADRIIAVGDPLLGSTVTDLQFYRGLNDAGQIVFFAQLADGRQVIVRADPTSVVPEPSTLALLSLGSLALAACTRRRRRMKAAR